MYICSNVYLIFVFPDYPLKYDFRRRLKPHSQNVDCPCGDPHACAGETTYSIPCSTQDFFKRLPVLQFRVFLLYDTKCNLQHGHLYGAVRCSMVL